MLQRMEAQGEDFESRLRALEGWRTAKAGEERRFSTIGARGPAGVVGGDVTDDGRGVKIAGRGGSGIGKHRSPSRPEYHPPLSRYLLPFSVRQYFCVGLFGEAGCVIWTKPAPIAGFRYS